MSKPLRALAVDVFAGGFALGVEKHFDVVAHLEESNYGVATVLKNRPDRKVLYGVEQWPTAEGFSIEERRKFEDLDFMFGNPPCAAWSVAGYTQSKGTDKWRTDPRVQCTERYFGLIDKLRPKAWVTESVTQAYSKGQEFFRPLEARALAMGYSVTYILHDSQWLKTPQSRKRFFMLVHRVDVAVPFPNFAPPITVMECLSEVKPRRKDWTVKIEPLVAKYLDNTYFEMPPGMRFRSYWEQYVKKPWKIGDRGQVVGRPSFGHKRLWKDRPSDVIVGYALVHPTQKRFITINEMQALCGFPDDYEFVASSPNAAASLIARGVCPPVGEWIAGVVASATERPRAVTSPKVRLIDMRTPNVLDQELDPKRPIEELPGGRHDEADEAGGDAADVVARHDRKQRVARRSAKPPAPKAEVRTVRGEGREAAQAGEGGRPHGLSPASHHVG